MAEANVTETVKDTPEKTAADILYPNQGKSEGEKPEEKVEGKEPPKEVEEKVEEKADDSSKDDADEKSKDGETDDDKDSGAPENYGDFELPEGMELDEKAMEQFVPIAKELDLSQEQAQKLVTLYSNQIKAQVDMQEETYSTIRNDWVKEVKADKEIGGEKFNENVATAREAVKTFGSDELTDMLNTTGLGDHPAVVKFFYKVGKAMKDDSIVHGGRAPAARDRAKILFPNQN